MIRTFLIVVSLLLIFSKTTHGTEGHRKVAFIVVHHSDTLSGNVEVFRKYHVNVRGWSDIGYHFVITNGTGVDGEIQRGRPIDKMGAHAKGRNRGSVGICLVGKTRFTEKQMDKLVLLITEMCQKYDIIPSEKTVQRHHEHCPGETLDLSIIIEKVKKALKKS
ncbi:MAG: peptidoglycan recognition protein family protein [Candidatus Pacebacteria bacterium]|nr:peptidoglycan recognition protein family protein [Candidatus Paceibacterota bacterium]